MKDWFVKYLALIRYLVAGIYNTVFGFGVFALLYSLAGGHFSYLIIAIISQIIAITNAFIVYKYWVFKSKGKLLSEYFKTYVVYSASFVLSIAGLGLLVELAHMHPIAGQAIVVVLTVLASYFGHSRYAFAKRS